MSDMLPTAKFKNVVNIGVNSDLTEVAFEYACEKLNNHPVILLVRHEDLRYATEVFGSMVSSVHELPCLKRCAWVVYDGEIFVYSDGCQ